MNGFENRKSGVSRTDFHGNADGLSIEGVVDVVDQDIDWEHIDRNVSRTRNTKRCSFTGERDETVTFRRRGKRNGGV